MAITFGVWEYVADDGKKFNIRIETNTGTAINGAPGTGSSEFPPSRSKMRHVDLRRLSGSGALRKRVPVVSKTSAIWTDASPANVTITGAGTYKVVGRVGEKRY